MSQTNVIIKIRRVLLFTLNVPRILPITTEELIFYADKIMLMGNLKNSRVFNFAILLKSRKSQKNYAHEIYMFYSNKFDNGISYGGELELHEPNSSSQGHEVNGMLFHRS